MKKKGNLYETVCSLENLILADKKARRGKGFTYGVKRHDKKRMENLLKLRDELLSQTFRTSEYSIRTIREPKERIIYRLPYYPDRIVHHAIMNVLEPIWVSIFTTDTYSCIKNRGIHAAAEKLKKTLLKDRAGTKYCLKLDVRKFYLSISHDKLKAFVRRKIKDKKLLWLLDLIIDTAEGVPIGNYLSQFFANLYLAYFDHWIKEEMKVKYYFRYADDIVILGSDKTVLHTLRREIKKQFAYLDLEIKKNWQVFPVDDGSDNPRGIDFVGYVFFHTHTLLRKTIKKNFFRKIAKLNKRLYITEKEYKQLLCSWWGWAKHCDSRNLIKTILKHSNYEFIFQY